MDHARVSHGIRAAAVALACTLAAAGCGSDGTADLTGPSGKKAPSSLPTGAEFRAALIAATDLGPDNENGGLGFHMWGTIVDRAGVVQMVVFTSESPVDQWPGSRVISAQKANTANAFSLTGFALSTANLYSAVQPGGSLFGLQESNPVDATIAYDGKIEDFGTVKDPLIGHRIGGVNVFGGGLALYNSDGELVGALGVSGDTSCADHIIAWKVRDALGLDFVPAGVDDGTDNIIHDITDGVSAGGFGHPECSEGSTDVANNLPTTHPIGANE
ncbi:MAG TPA: heme-binding protein [Gemmatimonadales bacterium]|nr:heme-binding protein [Gemmatimonadales bacterium]